MPLTFLPQPLTCQAEPTGFPATEVLWDPPPGAAGSPVADKHGGWAWFDGETPNFLIYEALGFINCPILWGLICSLGKSLTLRLSMPRPHPSREITSFRGLYLGEKLTLKVPRRILALIIIVVTLFWWLLWTWSWTGALYVSWVSKQLCVVSTITPLYRWRNWGLAKLCNLSCVTPLEGGGARSVPRANDSRAHYCGPVKDSWS